MACFQLTCLSSVGVYGDGWVQTWGDFLLAGMVVFSNFIAYVNVHIHTDAVETLHTEIDEGLID